MLTHKCQLWIVKGELERPSQIREKLKLLQVSVQSLMTCQPRNFSRAQTTLLAPFLCSFGTSIHLQLFYSTRRRRRFHTPSKESNRESWQQFQASCLGLIRERQRERERGRSERTRDPYLVLILPEH